jgi:hypothetical protein
MKSAAPGPSTSPAEVTNVSPLGFWLFIGERELFVPFNQFPWFREASVREITNVQLPSPHHLYWPDLDVDLAVESIEHSENYPWSVKCSLDVCNGRRSLGHQRSASAAAAETHGRVPTLEELIGLLDRCSAVAA